MYSEFLEQVLPTLGVALGLLLTALTGFLISFIDKKKKALQATTDSAMAKKYMQMVADTIKKCVIATNSNMVDNLKKQNAFTVEAQKEAFANTFNNVMSILGEDALIYLEEITGDTVKYIENAITAQVEAVK